MQEAEEARGQCENGDGTEAGNEARVQGGKSSKLGTRNLLQIPPAGNGAQIRPLNTPQGH